MKIILEHKNIESSNESLMKTAEAYMGELGIKFDKITLKNHDKRFWVFDVLSDPKDEEEPNVNFYIIQETSSGNFNEVIDQHDINIKIIETIINKSQAINNILDNMKELSEPDFEETMYKEEFDGSFEDDNENIEISQEDDEILDKVIEATKNYTKDELKLEYMEKLKLLKDLDNIDSPIDALELIVNYMDDDYIYERTEKFFLNEDDIE